MVYTRTDVERTTGLYGIDPVADVDSRVGSLGVVGAAGVIIGFCGETVGDTLPCGGGTGSTYGVRGVPGEFDNMIVMHH